MYLVTEYVNGGELYFHLAKGGPFNEDQARFYGAEIISALEYLHTNAIIHRDIKLENILLDREGHIKIVDFGLCKENIRWDSSTSTLCGTPEYRAPEIINNMKYGKDVDWWAFGIVMSEMIIGKNPFYNVDEEIMYENVLAIDVRFPSWLSNSARDLLAGLLTKEPANRLGGGVGGAKEVGEHIFFDKICIW